jgi:3-hydroxybutyryl-CoA dehydrogenase
MVTGQNRRVLVVGAGTMGQQIALQCAMHGCHVKLYDIAAHMLGVATDRVKQYTVELITKGQLTQEEANGLLTRIRTTDNPREAGADVDLLSESVPEDRKIKARVFAQYNQLCPSYTIFTTNTSTFIPSQIAKATGRPTQFAAFHFHLPVWDANIVDIMPHPGTSQETTRWLHDFARSIGQIPILIRKENHAYIFNCTLHGMLRPALVLAANGVASVGDIDRAWMGVTKMPIGPFGLLDLIGIDLVYHIVRRQVKWIFFMPQARRLMSFLQRYVNQGHLGIKSGKGFYTYPNPAFRQSGFIEGKSS